MGIGSVRSVRLETGTEVFGDLNLYALTPYAFDVTDLEMAGIFAQHAASALGSQEIVMTCVPRCGASN